MAAFTGILAGLFLAGVVVEAGSAELLPPGHRAIPLGVHAIKAQTVVTEPGESIEAGIILIRDGVIEDVGDDIDIPSDARVWELTNATVYAGFIDPYVVLDKKASARVRRYFCKERLSASSAARRKWVAARRSLSAKYSE